MSPIVDFEVKTTSFDFINGMIMLMDNQLIINYLFIKFKI
jgi:hypothetical protein